MSSLPNYQIHNAKLNQILPEQLRELQSTRLVNMVSYVYENAPFWKQKFDEAGVLPSDISGVEDLGKITFCDKKELLADQAEHPPFGSYTCTDKTQWAKMFSTSGTTGDPLRRVFSARDWSYMLQLKGVLPQNVNYAVKSDYVIPLLEGNGTWPAHIASNQKPYLEIIEFSSFVKWLSVAVSPTKLITLTYLN